MSRGIIFHLDEAIDDIATLYEQASLLSKVLTLMRRQYSSHPNFDVLFDHIERRRVLIYDQMTDRIGQLLNTAYIPHLAEDDSDA